MGLILTTVLGVGCQQGTRKDESTNLYRDGMVRCEEISAELKAEGVDLKTIQVPQTGDNNKILPVFILSSGDRQSRVQAKLEQFITAASELVSLGDEKVVLFPEKESIQKDLNTASILVGRIYAEKKWENNRNPVQSAQIDQAEFDARFFRISDSFRAIKDMGFKFEDEKSNPSVIKKLKKSDLLAIQKIDSRIGNDLFRNKELGERNNHWGLNGLEKFTEHAAAFGGYFYRINVLAEGELARRQK